MATFLSTLVTPAATSLASPATQELKVVAGQLLSLRLYVPPGPRGELYLRLFHRGVQIAPARIGTWWRLDNIVLTQPLDFPVLPGDEFFYLHGASPFANFSHSVDFELIVDPQVVASVRLSQTSILSRLQLIAGV